MPEKVSWTVAIVSIAVAVMPFSTGFLVQQIRFWSKGTQSTFMPQAVIIRLDSIERELSEVREDVKNQGKEVSEITGYIKGLQKG